MPPACGRRRAGAALRAGAPARSRPRCVAGLALGLGLALATALATPPAAAAQSEKELEQLAPRHREWLHDVRWLIPPKERKAFLELGTDYQRDAFIRLFWEARDPYPETARNEFREEWTARLEFVRDTWGNDEEDQARLWLLQGPPDSRFEWDCTHRMWPLEVWIYDQPAGTAGPIYLVFFKHGGFGRYRLWRGLADGLARLFIEPVDVLRSECRVLDDLGTGRPVPDWTGRMQNRLADADIDLACAAKLIWAYCPGKEPEQTETLIDALSKAYLADRLANYSVLLSRLELPPPPQQDEWLATFHAYSTDVPEGAKTFAVTPAIGFPRQEGGRIVVRIELAVPAAAVQAVELSGRRSYDFSLTGEVLRGEELFESFRYRFDAPAAEAVDTVPLIFQRLLRPGEFRLVLKLEDLHGGGFWREEIELSVPEEPPAPAAEEAPAGDAGEGALAAWLGGAGGEPAAPARVELHGPEGGVVTGMTRFDARVVGETVARVAFFLDGRQVMTKARPPYSLELDLGPVPRPHVVRAVAFDAEGRRLGLDELDLNAGEHRFAVRLLSPRSGEMHVGATELRAELAVPEGERLDRLELYVGEDRAVTLYQEPFLHTVELPAGPVYVRAVAYLEDGASREAVAFVNVTDPVEEIQVKLVELYASVLDGEGRPVTDLEREAFRVFEDGVEQEVVRFERVTDRPIHVALMVDSSASMAERIDAVRTAAAGFLERIMTPKDRAAVVAFADRTVEDVEFTGDVHDLAFGLAALQAERGTALYDNLIAVLYHLNGVQGQRAVLLLSDGEDRSSSFTFAQAREFARAAGVAIYAIGIDLPRTPLGTRWELSQLASDSGGASWFVGDVADLDRVYAAIESELRSKYLLVYQSTGTGTGFREVKVEAAGRGLAVKTLKGYYP